VRVLDAANRHDKRRPRLPSRAIGAGNGNLTTSACLKLAIGLGVGFGVPLAERAERTVRLAAAAGFGEDHALFDYLVNQLVARLQMQGGANRLWNGGLRLGRQLAGNHDGVDS